MASITVCGIRLPFDSASGETKGNIQIEGNRVQKRRKKLLNAVQNALNDPKELCETQQRYIGSKAVLLWALIEAAGKLDFNKRQSFQDYRELAHRTDLTRPYEEAVEVFLKSKGGGKYRAYCSYGCMHRAAQGILCDLLRLHHSPKSWQYGVKGRGVKEAVKRVRALHAKGFHYCAVLDVEAFYDCFHHAYILSDKIPGPYDLKKFPGSASIIS